MRAIKITSLITPIDVENELHALQQQVQGCIEEVRLRDGGLMLVNEEGMINGMPQNPVASLVAGTMIYGPALIVGQAGDEYADFPEAFTELLMIDGPV